MRTSRQPETWPLPCLCSKSHSLSGSWLGGLGLRLTSNQSFPPLLYLTKRLDRGGKQSEGRRERKEGRKNERKRERRKEKEDEAGETSSFSEQLSRYIANLSRLKPCHLTPSCRGPGGSRVVHLRKPSGLPLSNIGEGMDLTVTLGMLAWLAPNCVDAFGANLPLNSL